MDLGTEVVHNYCFLFIFILHYSVIFAFSFRPFKKLKVSPMNLYTAAKDCNVHKVLALLGLFSLVCYITLIFL